MNEKIVNFRDLQIWQLGIEIAKNIYSVTNSFPKSELFSIISQMRRASVSIASNIAEGFNRIHNSEYKHFLYITLGSCSELETQIEISFVLGYITSLQKNQLLEQLDHESRMVRNLIKKLK